MSARSNKADEHGFKNYSEVCSDEASRDCTFSQQSQTSDHAHHIHLGHKVTDAATQLATCSGFDGGKKTVRASSAGLFNQTYSRFCNICDHYRPFNDYGAWLRHEKEHEFIIVCQALAMACLTEECHFTCKRKEQMVKHLRKDHGVDHESQAIALAQRWRKSSGRKFWSCGLCIALFHTFSERLKHINSEHFKEGHSYQGIDLSNVKNGLLLQPRVMEAWQAELVAHHGSDRPKITWDPARIGNLQLQLELGANSRIAAQDLAKAAYEASEVSDWSPMSPVTLSLRTDIPSTHQHHPDPMSWDHPASTFGIDMVNAYGSSIPATRLDASIGNSYQPSRTNADNRDIDHDLQYSTSQADPVLFSYRSDFHDDEDNLFEEMIQ